MCLLTLAPDGCPRGYQVTCRPDAIAAWRIRPRVPERFWTEPLTNQDRNRKQPELLNFGANHKLSVQFRNSTVTLFTMATPAAQIREYPIHLPAFNWETADHSSFHWLQRVGCAGPGHRGRLQAQGALNVDRPIQTRTGQLTKRTNSPAACARRKRPSATSACSSRTPPTPRRTAGRQ